MHAEKAAALLAQTSTLKQARAEVLIAAVANASLGWSFPGRSLELKDQRSMSLSNPAVPFGRAVAFVPISSDRIAALPLLLENLHRLLPLFDVLSVTIIHDHRSKGHLDKTLASWAPRDRLPVTTLPENSRCQADNGTELPQEASVSRRMVRIARVRQTYIDELNRQDSDAHGTEWTLLVDSDMCKRWSDPTDFALALSRFGSDWAGVHANGVGAPGTCREGLYEDLLAWSPWGVDPRSPSKADPKFPGLSEFFRKNPTLFHLQPTHPPFEVRTGFGGLGIYKTARLRQCRYDCSGPQKCEHVPHQNCLRRRGWKLYVDPALVVPWKTDISCARRHFDKYAGPGIPSLEASCAPSWERGHRYAWGNETKVRLRALPGRGAEHRFGGHW